MSRYTDTGVLGGDMFESRVWPGDKHSSLPWEHSSCGPGCANQRDRLFASSGARAATSSLAGTVMVYRQPSRRL